MNIDFYDIGIFINHGKLSHEINYKALKQAWVSNKSYDFKKDSNTGNRLFRLYWLVDYHFISYSSKLKGVLCCYCVLFKPQLDRRVQSRFIINEFMKYKHFHDSVKLHLQYKWYRDSMNRENNFCNILENKKKCSSTNEFCSTTNNRVE